MNANQDNSHAVVETEKAHATAVCVSWENRIIGAMACSILALTIAACCCAPPSSGSTGASESGGASAPRRESLPMAPAPTRAPEVAQRVDLAALLADYKGNEVRADQIYKGKLIETTGSVGDVKKSIGDSMYLGTPCS